MDNSLKDDFHIRTNHLNALFRLIKSNKEEEFMSYLLKLERNEIDVNLRDETGNYLISFAVIMNNWKIVEALITYGARLDIIDSEGYSILYNPIKFDYREMVETLIKLNSKIIGISIINLKDNRGSVPLFYAIKYKNKHALEKLLNAGSDVNYKNNDNMNSLHLAVLRKDIEIVKKVLPNINNVNARTTKGSTALHYACNFGLTNIVQLLLANGAKQDIMEIEYDFYPVFYSVVQNNFEITKILIDSGLNPNLQDYQGNTILHYAIIYNHTEILNYILVSYIFIKQTDIYTENINSNLKLENESIPIDPNITNIDGLTILHLLLYNYRSDYLEFIRKIVVDSNINYQDNSGNTCLHIMVSNRIWSEFQDLLINKKLNIYIKNSSNQSVMDNVLPKDKEYFINTVTISYFNYLRKYHNGWLLKWQNNCSLYPSDKVDEKFCLEKIRTDIIKNKNSVPTKKNKINIIIETDSIVQFSTFNGSLLDMIVGFKYLTKTYSNTAAPFHANNKNSIDLEKYYQSLGIRENPNQFIIPFEIKWIYQKIFFPPNLEKIIEEIILTNKYRFIIFSIGIILSNGNHSNGLLYDISNSTMERFEPHGSNYPTNFNYNPDLLDDILSKKFSSIMSNVYKKNISLKYLAPKNYLPKIGFQTLENTEISVNKNIGDPNGFCTLWTIWYLDYRIRYFGSKPERIVKDLIEQVKINRYSLRDIIRNYSKRITDLRDYYLAQINKNINDYLNNRLEQADLEKLLQIIMSDK